MEELKIALVQSTIKWHNPDLNFDHTRELVLGIDETDLILLPEMWASGFTMQVHKNHQYTEKGLTLMHDFARHHSALVGGSLITKVGDKYYNRFYLVSADEVVATYDKKHLFAYAGEDRYFTSGRDQVVIEYNNWKLSLNVCYDLRFPVWTRNTSDYDILIYSANWPDKRIDAWDALLPARAIENQCFVLGTNCFGEDAWHNTYAGHSQAIGPDGKIISKLVGQSGVIQVTLVKKILETYREHLPFLKDRDLFEFK